MLKESKKHYRYNVKKANGVYVDYFKVYNFIKHESKSKFLSLSYLKSKAVAKFRIDSKTSENLVQFLIQEKFFEIKTCVILSIKLYKWPNNN